MFIWHLLAKRPIIKAGLDPRTNISVLSHFLYLNTYKIHYVLEIQFAVKTVRGNIKDKEESQVQQSNFLHSWLL